MSNDITTQDGATSTGPSFGEDTFEVNPTGTLDDAFSNAMNGILDDVEVEAPSEVQEETEELEVSGESDETSTPDDDSDVKEGDDEEEVKEEGEEEQSLVDYDEMKNFKFEIGGKHYSANDLKSALGQLNKQEEARNEVETARQELQKKEEDFKTYEHKVQTQQHLSAGTQQKAQLTNMYNDLNAKYSKAIEENNSHDVTMLGAQMKQVQDKYNEVESQVQQYQNEQAANAAKQLDSYGFGALNTDKQRQQAFKEYAFSNIPEGLVGVVNTNPELLAIVEKARLYDKSNSEVTKGKLKGSKKTLKGGAAKPPKPKTKDPLEAAFFAATQDMDFRS